MVDDACDFIGNPDLYGLGIRLGVYLQWLSSQIAVHFRIEGSTELSEAYLIFSLALAIGVLVLTFGQETDNRPHPVEILIMLYMIFGGLFSVRGYVKGRGVFAPVEWWRASLGLATIEVMAIYASWFWITGAKGAYFTQTDCGTVAFLFTKIPAGKFWQVSIFFACISVYLAVVLPPFLLIEYHEYVEAFVRSKVHPIKPQTKKKALELVNTKCQRILADLIEDEYELSESCAATARLEDITYTYLAIRTDAHKSLHIIRLYPPLTSLWTRGLHDRLRSISLNKRDIAAALEPEDARSRATTVTAYIRASFTDLHTFVTFRGSSEFNKLMATGLGCFLSGVYTMLAIELTIAWNQISGTYVIQSTGQLIPFVISIIGLAKVAQNIRFEFQVSQSGSTNTKIKLIAEVATPT